MSETGDYPAKPDRIFDEGDDDETFDPSNPTKSFNKMLNNNKKDLVSLALEEMSSYIYNRSSNVFGDELTSLIQCVSALRRGCNEQQEQKFWDNWLTEAKDSLSTVLFERILHEGLLYFKKDNKELLRHE